MTSAWPDEAAVKHRLKLTHRGSNHRHPWHAECSCGWGSTTATAFRQKETAKKAWTVHAEGKSVKPARRGRGGGPRPVTPDHLLPEQLRRTR